MTSAEAPGFPPQLAVATYAVTGRGRSCEPRRRRTTTVRHCAVRVEREMAVKKGGSGAGARAGRPCSLPTREPASAGAWRRQLGAPGCGFTMAPGVRTGHLTNARSRSISLNAGSQVEQIAETSPQRSSGTQPVSHHAFRRSTSPDGGSTSRPGQNISTVSKGAGCAGAATPSCLRPGVDEVKSTVDPPQFLACPGRPDLGGAPSASLSTHRGPGWQKGRTDDHAP
jgi:hypothetical protein